MKTLLIAAGLFFSLVEINLPAQGTPDSSPTAATSPATGKKPNIIFILCDDLGYGDVSFTGNPYIKTPNIDNLAHHGIVCSKGYAAYPICLPSRISILSGKYGERTGARMCVIGSPAKLDQPWLPLVLKNAGYTTCALGKWGLGDRFPATMKPMGFDTWAITHPGGGEDRWVYTINRPNGVKEPSHGRYVTDLLTDEAIKFIDQNSTHPFFIYLAEPAPHFPLQAPADEVAPFQNKPGINNGAAVIYAMVQHLDKRIGDLIAHLKEKGLYENTIIVFTSDNGADMTPWFGLKKLRWDADLAGEKTQVWEGGIKVPVVVSWPAVFGDNPKIYNGLVDGIDWQPTLLAAAGVTSTAPVDGVNLLPSFLDKAPTLNPTRFWSFNMVRPTIYGNGAMREGDWKLVRPPIPGFLTWGKAIPGVTASQYDPHKPYIFALNQADMPLPAKVPDYELFNLAQDPGEKHNLAAQQPGRMKKMEQTFEAWFDDVHSGPDNADMDPTTHLQKGRKTPATNRPENINITPKA